MAVNKIEKQTTTTTNNKNVMKSAEKMSNKFRKTLDRLAKN
ncbi:hypothetical protein [Paenibacillus sp. MMO-58]